MKLLKMEPFSTLFQRLVFGTGFFQHTHRCMQLCCWSGVPINMMKYYEFH